MNYNQDVRDFKRQYLIDALLRNDVNICATARELGMHRNSLARNAADLGINILELYNRVHSGPRGGKPAQPAVPVQNKAAAVH